MEYRRIEAHIINFRLDGANKQECEKNRIQDGIPLETLLAALLLQAGPAVIVPSWYPVAPVASLTGGGNLASDMVCTWN